MSGLFTLSDPLRGRAPCPAIGLNSCTDGTSNTIAFGEALVGISGRGNAYRGNGMATGAKHDQLPQHGRPAWTCSRRPPPPWPPRWPQCNDFWKTHAPGTTNRQRHEGASAGRCWAIGERSYTLFNTVIPPNSKDYPWSVCKLGSQGLGAQRVAVRSTPRATTPAAPTSRSPTAASSSSRTRST